MTQIDTRGEGGSKNVKKINTYYLNGPLGLVRIQTYKFGHISGGKGSKENTGVGDGGEGGGG
jgi:hypothetical protein